MGDRSRLRHRSRRARPDAARDSRLRETPRQATKMLSMTVRPREQLADLIGPAQAAANPLVDGERRHILAEEADAPGRRRKVAGDGVEQRRLAGAVRAEHRPPLAGADPKVDVGERDQARRTAGPRPRARAQRREFDERRSATAAVDHGGASLQRLHHGRHLQSGLSRLATPSLRKSASGMPSVWLTAGMTLTTLL